MNRNLKNSFIYRILRRVKRYFNWLILPDSAAILKSQRERIRCQIYTVLDQVKFVLDIGSGYRPISGFKKVVRIDIDPHCDVDVRSDAHYMPFANGAFDLVWLGGVLEHIRDSGMVIKEIYRILKDNGYVYVNSGIKSYQRQR